MADQPSEVEIQQWTRRFASQSNNRAWELVEAAARTEAETDEMLHAAHASARLWSAIGTELHAARAQLLLGIAHGLAGNGALAQRYAQAASSYFAIHECPDWEAAFVEAALAAAAHAVGDRAAHARHHARATQRAGVIADVEDREIFMRSFKRIPAP